MNKNANAGVSCNNIIITGSTSTTNGYIITTSYHHDTVLAITHLSGTIQIRSDIAATDTDIVTCIQVDTAVRVARNQAIGNVRNRTVGQVDTMTGIRRCRASFRVGVRTEDTVVNLTLAVGRRNLRAAETGNRTIADNKTLGHRTIHIDTHIGISGKQSGAVGRRQTYNAVAHRHIGGSPVRDTVVRHIVDSQAVDDGASGIGIFNFQTVCGATCIQGNPRTIDSHLLGNAPKFDAPHIDGAGHTKVDGVGSVGSVRRIVHLRNCPTQRASGRCSVIGIVVKRRHRKDCGNRRGACQPQQQKTC